jgi:hypothetical protein
MGRMARLAAVTAAAVSVIVSICSAPARADEPRVNELVGQVLIDGWGASPAAQELAKSRYLSASALAPLSSRPDLAFGFVQFKRLQFDEAQKLFDAAASKNSADLAAWRASIFLAALRRQHETTLAKMKSLAELFPKEQVSKEMDDELRETAELMGKLVGYIETAAENPPEKSIVASFAGSIAERLSGEHRKAYDAARAEVAATHRSLADEKARAFDEDLAADKKQKEEDLAYVAGERVRIDGDVAKLKKEFDAAKELADQKLSSIDGQLAPLRQRYNDLMRQAQPIIDRVRDLEFEAARVRSTATKKDKDGKTVTDQNRLREADNLLARANDERRRLRPLQDEAARVEGQAAKLERERVGVVAAFQAEANGLNGQARKLQSTFKLLDAKEKEASRSPSGNSGRVGSLNARLTALTSYYRFPLELERQRLLDAVK